MTDEKLSPQELLTTLDARLAHYIAKHDDPHKETTVLEDMLYAALCEARGYVIDAIPVRGETATERAVREAQNAILEALRAFRDSRRTATYITHATAALRVAEEARATLRAGQRQGVRIPPVEEPDKHPALQGDHTRSKNTPDLLRELEALVRRQMEIVDQLGANQE